jgi:antitoxin MazE
METTIQKWGNSLAVRLSRDVVQETNLQEGTRVRVTLEKGRIVVRAVRKRQYSLRGLLTRVTRKNIHAEFDKGDAVGKEAW